METDTLIPIQGFPNYAATVDGEIFNLKKNRVLKPVTVNGGYKKISLPGKPNAYVQIIMWSAFYGTPPDGAVVEFRDGNKGNCEIANLYLTLPSSGPVPKYGWCCSKGHQLSPANTVYGAGRSRICRACSGLPRTWMSPPNSWHAHWGTNLTEVCG